MPIDRRKFLRAAGTAATLGLLGPVSSVARAGAAPMTIKAIAFDAFPIFDPRPVFRLAAQLFPERGAELADAWRTRQFEYQWLRALSGSYADFRQATEDALVFSAELLQLDLSDEKRVALVNAYFQLNVWPDVLPALASMRSAGLRLAFLSNATPQILRAGIRNAAMENLFEHVLSTDEIRTFKPDRHAYQMAVDAFELDVREILFVAFAGWDAAGAKWFGYPTFWLNRLGLPGEQLGVTPDAEGATMAELVDYLGVADVPENGRHERA